MGREEDGTNEDGGGTEGTEGTGGKDGKEVRGAGRPRGDRRCAHLEGCEALPAEVIYGVPEEGVARYEKINRKR